jgi:hypothetical protein
MFPVRTLLEMDDSSTSSSGRTHRRGVPSVDVSMVICLLERFRGAKEENLEIINKRNSVFAMSNWD